MPSHGAPAFVVYRRYLGAIGSLLAALAVALSAYAMHAAAPGAQARLLQAAVFAFAHGVALTARNACRTMVLPWAAIFMTISSQVD